MKFKVNIKPMGKASVRVTRNGSHMPQTTKDFMNNIAWEFRKAFVGHRISLKPIRMDITATFAVPPSISKKERLRRLEMKYHTFKPDRDNIEKGVQDALNGLAYKDDSQVCDGRTLKLWGEEDSVEIEIVEII